ncbi:Sucraseferredoxin-like protein [Meredithblackwellia eburnea MCA 4105]
MTAATFEPRPALPSDIQSALASAKVPLISLEEACRACAHNDGDDIESYPKGFGTDMTSLMLGTMNDYHRQIVISTGKSDWIREVTDDQDTLPGLTRIAYDAHVPKEGKAAKLLGKLSKKFLGGGSGPTNTNGNATPPATAPSIEGVYASSASVEPSPEEGLAGRLSVLNGSNLSCSDDDESDSVLVFPDFKIVKEVSHTSQGAKDLVDTYLKPNVGRAGSGEATSLKSWPLPYQAVVLLCSHKKRDKKCHIAAPLLISQFHHHLELHGLEGDERGDDVIDGPAIEEWDPDTRERRLEESLKGVKKNGNKVGIFKVSHIGGHRYAGNVIVYFPNGTSIWYGRVTPRDVGAVVDTMLSGKIIPELLRGGLGLVGKDGPEGVLGW